MGRDHTRGDRRHQRIFHAARRFQHLDRSQHVLTPQRHQRNDYGLAILQRSPECALINDQNGKLVSTTTIGAGFLTGPLGTINGLSLSAGGSVTINAASSTALGDVNSWAARQTFANSSTTLATISGTTWLSGLTSALLSTDSNGKIVGTTSVDVGYISRAVANTRALTVAGTASQITSSASAQDLSADRTWTLSLPNHVIFPSSFFAATASTTNATSSSLFVTTIASTTKFYANGLTTCNSGNVLTWANGDFGCAADQTVEEVHRRSRHLPTPE